MEKIRLLTGKLLFVITLLYAVFAIFLHQEVSKIAVGSRPELTGSFIPRNFSVEGGLIFIAIILIILILKYVKGVNKIYNLIYIYIYLLFVYLYFILYSLHPVEVIHIIHYSILVILLGYTFDRNKKYFFFSEFIMIGFLVGLFDETIQYFVLVPGQKYLDFNDVYVNTLGTIAGALLYYAFKPFPNQQVSYFRSFKSKKTFFILSFLVTFLIAMIVNGNIRAEIDHFIQVGAIEIVDGETVIFLERRPNQLGHYLNHFVKGYFYNLDPIEWSILTTFTFLIVLSYDPRSFASIKFFQIIRSLDKNKTDVVEGLTKS